MMNQYPSSEYGQSSHLKWLDENAAQLSEDLIEAQLSYAEALDSNNNAGRFRIIREIAITEDRILHLHELGEILDTSANPRASLEERRAELGAMLKAQNTLIDTVEGNLSVIGQFKAGIEAAKIRSKMNDLLNLINILD